MGPPTAYQSSLAIPLPSDDVIRELIGPSYDPASTLNVTKMLAGTDDMFPATAGLVKAVFQAEGIDPKLREMIILRAAKALNAPYEWQANARMGENTGLSPAEIEAAASDGPVVGIDRDYVLACRATDELSNEGTLQDGTLAALLERWGETTSRKLRHLSSALDWTSRPTNSC